jgi:hypothetical protein
MEALMYAIIVIAIGVAFILGVAVGLWNGKSL